MRKLLVFLTLLSSVFLVACTPITAEDVTIVLKDGIDTVEINSAFTDAGAKATAGWLPLQIEIVEDTVDATAVGTYRIVYRCTYREIVKEVVRYVAVVDEIGPAVVLNPGIDTLYEGDVWIDAGVTATDDDGDPVAVLVRGVVLADLPGEYIITYVAADGAGNESVVVRYVNVLEAPDA